MTRFGTVLFALGVLVAITPLFLLPNAELRAADPQVVYCESGEQVESDAPYTVWIAPCKTSSGEAVQVVMID